MRRQATFAVPTDSSTSGGRHRASHCRVQKKCRQKIQDTFAFSLAPHALTASSAQKLAAMVLEGELAATSPVLLRACSTLSLVGVETYQFHVVGCRSGKASRSPSSGASLQSNLDDPDGWNSDVSQMHTVPNTINPGEGEAAEHAAVLPSVSNDVYATWKRRNRQKHAEREAKCELMAQLEIIHTAALQTLQGRESRSVQILWQTLWLKHLRTILQENGGPA